MAATNQSSLDPRRQMVWLRFTRVERLTWPWASFTIFVFLPHSTSQPPIWYNGWNTTCRRWASPWYYSNSAVCSTRSASESPTVRNQRYTAMKMVKGWKFSRKVSISQWKYDEVSSVIGYSWSVIFAGIYFAISAKWKFQRISLSRSRRKNLKC